MEKERGTESGWGSPRGSVLVVSNLLFLLEKTHPAVWLRSSSLMVALLTCHPEITALTAAGPLKVSGFGS